MSLCPEMNSQTTPVSNVLYLHTEGITDDAGGD